MKQIFYALFLLAGVSVAAEILWKDDFKNGAYTISRPETVKMEGFWRLLPPEAFQGKLIRLTGEWRGEEVAAGARDYLGPKVMFALGEGKTIRYPGIPGKYGSFDWTPFELACFVPPDCPKIGLFLGFQEGKGTLSFRNVKIETLGTPLDFTPAANMAWLDDDAGNGKGGWSDQGPGADGRCFLPYLSTKLLANAPFEVLTKGDAILTMHSNHFKNGPKEVTIPLTTPVRANSLYLLHTLCWGPKEEVEIGAAVVEYQDGGSERIPIRSKTDVADWIQKEALPNGALGVRARGTDGDWRNLYVSRFPLKKGGLVKSVRFEASSPATLWIIAAATLSETPYDLPVPAEKVKTVIVPGPDWLPVAREDYNRRKKDSALDLSNLLERAPAGTHGRVIIRPDGHFAFEKRPEQIQRFFSAGVSFKLESRWQVDQLADELVKNGYNMVRIHIPENTLMHGSGRTLQFNSHYLDLFDYLAAALKKRGIYMMCDMAGSIIYGWEPYPTNHWGSTHRDNSRPRKRLVIHFDEQARAEWRQGVEQLLCRENPYTQTRLIDDPVLAMVLGYNEQEFEFSRQFPPELVAPHYRAFLERKYGSIEAYNRKWRSNFTAFSGIPCFTTREGGNSDVQEFLYETEGNTARWYREQLRELGYRGPVSSYNVFKTHHFNRIRRESCDYIAMNSYHGHPTNWVEPGSEVSQESSIAKSANLFRDIISGRFHGKPLVVTEYQCVYWNRYRYEQPFVFGAFAALQGLDAISMHTEPVSLKPMVFGNSRIVSFVGYQDPIAVASEFLTFFLYLREDVKATPDTVRILVPPDNAGIANPNTTLSKTQNSLALIHGFSMTGEPDPKAMLFTLKDGARTAGTEAFSQSVDEGANLVPYLKILKEKGFLPPTNRSNGINLFESSTAELLLDADKRLMAVNTPRFQGICAEAGTQWALPDFAVERMSVRGNLSLVSIDGRQSLRDAKRLVLVYATNVLGNGMTFADRDMVRLVTAGRGPALLQRGEFRVRIRNRQAAQLKLYPLDLEGNRLKEIAPAKVDGEHAVFSVDTGRDGAAVFFEVSVK